MGLVRTQPTLGLYAGGLVNISLCWKLSAAGWAPKYIKCFMLEHLIRTVFDMMDNGGWV